LNPNYAEVLLERGLVLMKLGHKKEARANLNKSASINPSFFISEVIKLKRQHIKYKWHQLTNAAQDLLKSSIFQGELK
jgi:tetratricopeptide (TPR) repeat protein